MNDLEIRVAAEFYAMARDQHEELKQRINLSVDDPAQRARMLKEAEPDVRARFRRIATRLMQKSGADIPHRPEVCSRHPNPEIRQRRDREHAVPLAMIHDRILGLRTEWDGDHPAPRSSEEIAELLRHHILVIGVTQTQHAQVLPATMPKGWRWFGDRMARYRGRLVIDEDGKCKHCRERTATLHTDPAT